VQGAYLEAEHSKECPASLFFLPPDVKGENRNVWEMSSLRQSEDREKKRVAVIFSSTLFPCCQSPITRNITNL